MNKLPEEIINLINEFKPVHPLNREIREWKEYNDILRHHKRNPSRFLTHYFKNDKRNDMRKKRKEIEDNHKYLYKCALEDGLTICRTIRLYYELRQENKRLNKKLDSLNIELWDISSTNHFPKKNKHGNFREVYHNKIEIIF